MTRSGRRDVTLAVVLAAAAVLWPLPDTQRSRIDTSVLIDRPVHEVFDFVTTPLYWPRWHPASISVRGSTTQPLTRGQTVTEDFAILGLRGTVTWRVLEADRPQRWIIDGRIEHAWPGRLGGSIRYSLSDRGGSTLFQRSFEYHRVNALCALVDWLVLREQMRLDSTQALLQLRALLERSPSGRQTQGETQDRR